MLAPGQISNGDVFRWCDLWPKIAAWFGLEVAQPLAVPLAKVLARACDWSTAGRGEHRQEEAWPGRWLAGTACTVQGSCSDSTCGADQQ